MLAATVWNSAHLPLGLSDRNKVMLGPGCEGCARCNLYKKTRDRSCSLWKGGDVVATSQLALREMCESSRMVMCVENNTHLYLVRTSNNRVISSGYLYNCMLPQCEALRTCRSSFPIATQEIEPTSLSFACPSPVTAGGFAVLSVPNWNVKYYKSVEYVSILECQVPPHKCKASCRTAKRPYWKLSSDGSAMHAVFLDASKAFDRVLHMKLFEELIQRKVQRCQCILCDCCNIGTSNKRCKSNGTSICLTRFMLLICNVGVINLYCLRFDGVTMFTQP